MRILIVAFVLLSSCGHARAVAPSWTDQRCQSLMDQRDAATWGAAFSGGLSGVGGLSASLPEDSSRKAQIGLGVSTAVLAAAATSLTVLAALKSREFEQWCGRTTDADGGVK